MSTKDEKTPCRFCCSLIDVNAKVCHHCSQFQSLHNRWRDIGVLIAFFSALISLGSCYEASKERANAEQALRELYQVGDIIMDGTGRIGGVTEENRKEYDDLKRRSLR